MRPDDKLILNVFFFLTKARSVSMDDLLVGTVVTGQKGQCNDKGYFA